MKLGFKNSKRILALAMASTILLAGCAGNAPEDSGDVGEGDKDSKGYALIVNGTIGDKSFNDLANAGLQKAAAELDIRTKLVENNYDTTKYESVLIEFSEDPEWDVMILNGYDIKETVEKVAPNYPDKKYIVYDADIDFTKPGLSNVYSTSYKQNEASFIAGAAAAKVTSSGIDNTNPEKVIGFIAGGENTIINDFLVGYIEGSQYADPEVKMLISYIGDFKNSAKGKEMGTAQYMQGSDIIFQVAAGAGLGVIDSAKEAERFAIGVDSDQYELFKDTSIEQANAIMTSVVKKVDETIYSCIVRDVDSQIPYGTHEIQGLKEGAVGLAKNSYYASIVPQEIQDFVNDVEAQIIAGEIVVGTAIGKSTDEINEIRDSIKAN